MQAGIKALAAAALACAAQAQAVQVFAYTFSGEAHNVGGGMTGGTFSGLLTLTLADGDGLHYSGGSLLGLDIQATVDGVVPGLLPGPYRLTLDLHSDTARAATNGEQVTMLDATLGRGWVNAAISDDFIQFIDWSGQYAVRDIGPYISATGTLAPVSAVPEPTDFALLLAGLGVLALHRRVSRRAARSCHAAP